MGLIPQVKCGRCDRTYSGLRSRCPYCGAHRHKKGKRTTDGDNSTWKLIIGVLLIVVLIAAVIVILVTSGKEKNIDNDTGEGNEQVNNANEGTEGTGGNGDNDADDGGEGDGDNGEGTGGDNGEGNGEGTGGDNGEDNGEGTGGDNGEGTGGEGTGGDDGTQTPTVIASAVTVKSHYGTAAVDYTIKIGEVIHCTATITPSNCTSIPVWSSDNPAVSVIPTDETGLKADITGMSRGVANITVTVDSLTYTFIARCDGSTMG